MNGYAFNKTKTVATLGPACSDKETLLQMVREGLDVARLNFSHADHETHARMLKMVREINRELNTNIAILQDLQGPKIRIGNLEEPFPIKKDDIITLRCDLVEQGPDYLPIIYETFAKDVSEGDKVLVDDGKVELVVVHTDRQHMVQLKVVHGTVINSRKGVNLPYTKISVPSVTEKDFKDIDFAIEHDVEWIALSFVRSPHDVRVLKELIRLKNGRSRIIAKIEKPEALENIDEIIAVADGIMVARGDLGVEIPMEEVPKWQKRIVRKCNEAVKPVIVATQVMESMMNNARPTRAEASDVANAVVDGADAIMLSGETSVGKHPVLVIGSMNRIIRSVEKEATDIYYRQTSVTGKEKYHINRAVTLTACRLVKETKAKAIVGMTNSGFTAFQISNGRPDASIFIFTPKPEVCTMLNLLWGVRAFVYDRFESTDQTFSDVQEILEEKGLLKRGDVVVNTASMPIHEHGLTNMIKVSVVK